MPKLITVFGAGGRQGASVVKALSRDNNFTVRAVVTGESNVALKAPEATSSEIVHCDLGNREAVKEYVKGAYGCFVLTKTDVTRTDAMEKEIQEGKNIADACAFHKTEHVVLSTQLNTERALGIVARNMVAKARTEDYMRKINVPITGLIVPCYYEHLLNIFKPSKVGPSEYEIAIPIGTQIWDIISVADVGEVVRQIFNDRGQYLDKTLSVAGDKLTIKEIAAILSRQLAPRRFKDKQITVNEYQHLGFPWCRDFAVMFDFFCRVDQRYNVNTTRGINSGLQRFEDWVKCHHDDFCLILDTTPIQGGALFDWT